MAAPAEVAAHYAADGLVARLRAALAAAGMDDRVPTPRDLAPLDQFHAGGLAATLALADALPTAPAARVLDIGAGLGGPARLLASRGCDVTGIDLSPAFVEAATFLTACAGLAEHARFRQADALSLPFADASFDIAWTQHVAMNIADRPRLYAEAHRVLRPGGHLAIYDVVSGDDEPQYPVPWARDATTSFLLGPAAMRATLEEAGFRIVSWIDRRELALAVFAQRRDAPPAPLGLHLVMGEDFPVLSANLARNLRERRVGLIEAILQRS